MSKKILLASLMMFLLMAPSIVTANIDFWPNDISGWGNDALGLFFGPNIPEYMLENAYTILQWLIFPFFALWAVIYGIMNEINLFRNSDRITLIISLLIAAIAGPTGGLVYIVRILFVAIGSWTMIVFVVVLFAGITFWARGNLHRFGGRLGRWGSKDANKYLELEGEIARLVQDRRWLKAHDGTYEELKDLENKIADKEKALRRLRNTVRRSKGHRAGS